MRMLGYYYENVYHLQLLQTLRFGYCICFLHQVYGNKESNKVRSVRKHQSRLLGIERCTNQINNSVKIK
jgi:hypothetical protein